MDAGEDANQAALREVWEEAGLRVTLVGPAGWEQIDTETNHDLVPPIFVNRHKINEVHDHSAFVFAARAETDKIDPQAEEDQIASAEFVWVTQEGLDHMLVTDPRMRKEVHRYASTALELCK